MAALTVLDVVVLVLVGVGALLGGMRGFVTEVLSLFAWVAAIFALKAGAAPLGLVLGHYVGNGRAAALLSLVLVFGIVFFIGKLLAGAIGRRTRQSILGPLDRVLGFGFGALKGLIGATLIFLFASVATDTFYGPGSERPEWMRTSRTFPLLNASSRAVVDLVAMRRAGWRATTDEAANTADGARAH